LGDVASTARTETAFLDDPMIAADLSRGTFDFRDMKREPVTVFISLPPGKLKQQAKWLRLVMTAAIKAGMMRPRRPHEPRCLMVFDEAAALGRFDLLADNYAVARGYGVQFLCAFQNIQQLKDCYDKAAGTFLANAGLIASFAPSDMESAKWLSELSGTTTRTVASYSASSSFNGGDSGNNQERSGWSTGDNLTFAQQAFPLFSEHDLRGLPQGCMMLARAGSANVFLTFAPYYSKRNDCAGRFRPNPFIEDVTRRASIAASSPVAADYSIRTPVF
jgi:type IV secretion system protein VirD4